MLFTELRSLREYFPPPSLGEQNNGCFRVTEEREDGPEKSVEETRIQKILFPATGAGTREQGRGRVDLTEQMQRIGADLFPHVGRARHRARNDVEIGWSGSLNRGREL